MSKKATPAYVIGFCKTAEAYGVDPEALYKYAHGLKPAAEFANALQAARNSSLLGSFGIGMKLGWNTSLPGRMLNPVFRPIARGVKGFFTKKPSASEALRSYATRARSGVAPSNEEAVATLDKVLSEYFGRKVPG